METTEIESFELLRKDLDLPVGLSPFLTDRYEFVRVVGSGSTATVYEARDRDHDRTLAIKVLHCEPAGGELLVRFRQEISIASFLRHPGIVPVYDGGVAFDAAGEPVHYLTMAYIGGGRTLAHLNPEPREAAALLERIADAVAFAHSRGIVHRDLKPGNILIDSEGNPWVTDFGLAKRLEATNPGTDTGTVLGTAPYMSPEQVLGVPGLQSVRTDVYALGVILYELVAGRTPHDVSSIAVLFEQILHSDPHPPSRFRPDLSRDLEAIILRALEKDPTRRFSDAAEMREELARFRRGEIRPMGFWKRVLRRF